MSLLLATVAAPSMGSLHPVAAGPFAAAPLAAQLRPAPELQEAYFAWDEGRYVEAIEGYLAVLGGPEGERHVAEIARLTGEVHPVRELDDDGRFAQVSPDGRFLGWAREVEGAWRVHVEPVGGGARTVLPGRELALSTTGRAAYLDEGQLRIRVLATGHDTPAGLGPARFAGFRFAPDADVLYAAATEEGEDAVALFRFSAPDWRPERIDVDVPVAVDPRPAAGGRVLFYEIPERSPFAGAGAEASPTGGPALGAVDLETGRTLLLPRGTGLSIAREGGFAAYVRPWDDRSPTAIVGIPLGDGVPASPEALPVLAESDRPLGDPAVSPDGSELAYKFMPHVSWEVFRVPTDGSASRSPGIQADPAPGVRRVTREVQHDQFPAWIDGERLLALKGEWRHRRSYVYPLAGGEGYRLFHNNTLRTIAPEYEWVPSPDGRGVLVTAERDGNTIDPERGVFWVDLTREVGAAELEARLRASLAAERDLLERGEARFAPLADEVRAVTARVSPGRVFHYADALYRMGSKFIGRPGNLAATAYLRETLESWGYEVELQWFEPRGMPAANVVARLPGTSDPGLVYVISSHFDSVLPSPGADDNSSGTTALLEVARVLRDHPRRASVEFAFLTAEEAGLLGAREYVRRAVDERKRVTAVLNNDMIGWNRSHRLDNTVRHANAGIRDLQHAAAHFFSDLITYDAFYTRGTDAAVFQDAYGDVIGGIGSYPVLGNPHYHQRTDAVATVNHRLVAEVARTTAASIMLLADSPARLEELHVARREGNDALVRWVAAPETGIEGYRIEVLRPGAAGAETEIAEAAEAWIRGAAPGTRVLVRALGSNGTEGWDWAELVIE